MKVTILGPNLPDQRKGNFHVHATGCADLKRGQYRRVQIDGYAYEEEHGSVKSVVDSMYGPSAGGFYAENGLDPETAWEDYVDDFYFAPCVAELPQVDQ